MAKRSGFYIENNTIVQKVVDINWELGFDKKAKHTYIERIIKALGEELQPAIDVTSASNVEEGKALSPLLLRVPGRNMSVEDLQRDLGAYDIPGLADYYYLRALQDSHIATVNRHKCFIDVFHNPEKSFGNTQACSLAVYKLLRQIGRLDLIAIGNKDKFVDWYQNMMLKRWET